MTTYTAEDALVLAKRHHNTKRTYLLVNPLQAKHLPVSPSKSLEMMECLGKQIAKKYPTAKLVIGFAETATAIAATVAGCIGCDCKYIHTTRESYEGFSDWICFNEEHSHAVEQKLWAKDLAQWISATSQIILVDDEISTGKTIINIVEQLQKSFPEVREKQIVAASIINRMSSEHKARFLDAGIESESLVKLNNDDLTSKVAHYDITPAESVIGDICEDTIIQAPETLMDSRLGVDISKYIAHCKALSEKVAKTLLNGLKPASNVLVLGTEESMYPALTLGRELEKCSSIKSVKCHATTRSPIGICTDPLYPIRLGYKIHSFYDENRETYIYNLACYDMVVVLTDTCCDDRKARADISKALRINGCQKTIFIEGGNRV